MAGQPAVEPMLARQFRSERFLSGSGRAIVRGADESEQERTMRRRGAKA